MSFCLSVCPSVLLSLCPLPFFQNLITQPNEVKSSQNFQGKFLGVSQDDPICQGWPYPPSLQSGTINVIQVWTLRMWGPDTLLIMLESWKLAHNSIITYHDDPWCQGWLHPPSIQSGTINNLQVWTSRTGGSWHTSNHARELKFGTQVKNYISWPSMMSRMAPSSKYSVRNHQRPPSMDFEDGGFLTHF